jgi:hypothetical protein
MEQPADFTKYAVGSVAKRKLASYVAGGDPGDAKALIDAAFRSEVEAEGIESCELLLKGKSVGTVSMRRRFNVDGKVAILADRDSFVGWLCGTDEGRDVVARLVDARFEQIARMATAEGEIPDGVAFERLSPLETMSTSVVTVNEAKLLKAIGRKGFEKEYLDLSRGLRLL